MSIHTILEAISSEYVGLSPNQLLKIAKEQGSNITRKQVDEFLNQKGVVSDTLPVDKKHGHIFSFEPQMNIQMDLVDMSKYYRANKGYKWILMIIDVFTRKGYGYPLKNKGVKAVYDALNHFFENEFIPHSIMSDNGSEFMNKRVQELFNKNDINHFTTTPNDHTPLGVVDRFIQTLKVKINRYFTQNNTTKWIDLFDNFIMSYNNTPHTGILDILPSEAHKELNRIHLSIENISKMKRHIDLRNRRQSKFNVGDRVRILLRVSKLGRRATEPRYTRGIFTIQEIKRNRTVLEGVKEKIPLKWLAKVNRNESRDTNKKDAVGEVNQFMRRTRALQREGLVDTQTDTARLIRKATELRERRNRYEL